MLATLISLALTPGAPFLYLSHAVVAAALDELGPLPEDDPPSVRAPLDPDEPAPGSEDVPPSVGPDPTAD